MRYEPYVTRELDVLVIGGGPAGSSVANLLAQRGRSVLVVERETFPRFHIGESLLPRSLPILDRLGVRTELDAGYLRKYGARFCDSVTGRIMHYRFAEAFEADPPHAYQVPRADFDRMLLRRAVGAGAMVREGWCVRRVLFDGERAIGVEAQSPEGRSFEIGASFIVDASGRDTLLASKWANKKRIPGLDKHGFFSHWEGVWRASGDDEGNIQIVVFDHGWFWFIPFAGRTTSVGFIASSDYARTKRRDESLDDFFDRTVALSSFARQWLGGAKRLRPVSAVADFSYRVRRLLGPGWLLLGDASGFIDPLFSTGVHLALTGAERASSALAEALETGDDSPARFAPYVDTLGFGTKLCVGAVQAFYRGEFRDLLFATDQSPTMRRIIVSLLSGDVFKSAERWVQPVVNRYPAQLDDDGEVRPNDG